jgi:polysaccharide export outer membrane protein
MFRTVIFACLAALLLAACSIAPEGRDVIAQAKPDGQIAFDVVKIDDAVLATSLAQGQPSFPERFKQYTPPPALKIGIGDIVSVVIWEASGDGLFGESLTEVSLPPGAVTRRLLSPATPPLGSAAAALQELAPALDLSLLLGGNAAQSTAPSLDLSGAIFGGATGQASTGGAGQLPAGGAAAGAAGQAPAGAAALLAPLVAGGTLAQQGLSNGSLPTSALSALQPAQRAVAESASNGNLEALLEAAVQSGRPGTRIPDQQVGLDGAISIPYAGRIVAAGHTPEEVQRTIEQRLASKAIEPQALVVISRNFANSVSVEGEIVGGKRLALSPGGERLLQLIAAAGGARAPVHETFVRLSRGGVTATVPLATLVADPAQDIFAEPGDVLTLVRRPQTFSVFGATGKNTAITFNSEKLSLSEALGKAGGLLDDRADPSAVFLFRYEPVDVVRALGQPVATGAPPGLSPIAYRLDLREAKSYLLARQFPVHDKDIIFVADAESQAVYKFFLVLSQIVGPVETGLLTCVNANVKC